MAGGQRFPGAVPLAAFAAAVVLGGGNFLAVRFSNEELAPFWGAGLRFGVAATLFVVIALLLRLPWPRGELLRRTAVYGVLSFAVFYALMYWALLRVTAGVATIVLAVVPLVTVLLAAAHRLEPLRGRSVVGAVFALAGIGAMIAGPEAVDLPATALLAMLAAALCVGESIILSKRISGNHPVMTNAVGMSAGVPLLLLLSAFSGEQWALPRQPASAWALAYLVTLGSVGLFVLILLVIRRWTPSATSYLFVLFPVATLVLGALLADEPVTLQAVVGALIVMTGVWLGALSPAARRLPAAHPVTAPPASSG